MKIAAFNVENLFDRARAFNQDNSVSTPIIDAVAELNIIFEKKTYSATDKRRIIHLLKVLKLENSDSNKFAILRKIRGKIVKRARGSSMSIVADGREDWIGWMELTTAPVNERAVINTGRVIKDVAADILAVVEAENRVSLEMFSNVILDKVNARPYKEVMLIDGNDRRGIDVGVMCRGGYKVEGVKSHIYDLRGNRQPIFSRDCPEYKISCPSGETIIVLPNHFKSKYGGNDRKSQNKRKAQAKKTAEIYERLKSEGYKNIVVLGDLNDTPDSKPLKPLLKNTDLKDVSLHPSFSTGKFKGTGTYGLGNDNSKIDYLLLSPNLFSKVQESGLFRKGAWAGSRPKRWNTYDTITKKIHVASDHHVIWAEIDI